MLYLYLQDLAREHGVQYHQGQFVRLYLYLLYTRMQGQEEGIFILV